MNNIKWRKAPIEGDGLWAVDYTAFVTISEEGQRLVGAVWKATEGWRWLVRSYDKRCRKRKLAKDGWSNTLKGAKGDAERVMVKEIARGR
jgi:hypothetical protein